MDTKRISRRSAGRGRLAKPTTKGGLDYAVGLVEQICAVAGSRTLVTEVKAAEHTSVAIFNRLLDAFAFQGISDEVAAGYLKEHGRVGWWDLAGSFKSGPKCAKLRSYWSFRGCGYQKTKRTCAHPRLLDRCPLPCHDMRNGHLNQTAYSFFLFVRDVADGDLKGWIEDRLRNAHEQALLVALVDPLRNVFGVSDKVLNMALSEVLLAAPSASHRWKQAAFDMLAVDSLVHNFLHRSGCLRRLDARHAYGVACYGPKGCAWLMRRIAERIDATQFSARYPKHFPRFVQHAVWRFCAQREFNVCNGNRIDDRSRCDQTACQMFRLCDRVALQPRKPDGG